MVTEGAAPVIRPARPDDVAAIHRLIRELADYERSLDQVQATAADLHEALFCAQPALFAHVATCEGEIAGFALWFLSYSTWTGRHGIYLEDLIVTRRARRSGIGAALMAQLARICVERGYTRLEWAALDWNEPALAFYRSLGAATLDDWITHRLSGEALVALAQG